MRPEARKRLRQENLAGIDGLINTLRETSLSKFRDYTDWGTIYHISYPPQKLQNVTQVSVFNVEYKGEGKFSEACLYLIQSKDGFWVHSWFWAAGRYAGGNEKLIQIEAEDKDKAKAKAKAFMIQKLRIARERQVVAIAKL